MPQFTVFSGSFLGSIGNIISIILNIYIWIIIIRVLLSWINPNPYSPFMRFLLTATGPALRLTRRLCPLTLGGLDCSPILLIIILNLLAIFLKSGLTLIGAGYSTMVLLPIFCISLIMLISSLNWLLIVLMVIRIVMSLVNPSPYNPIVMIVYALTEPLLSPLRRWFPKGPKGLDIKALIFVVGLVIFNNIVLTSLIVASNNWISDFASPGFLF